jgi:hypothetical protein
MEGENRAVVKNHMTVIELMEAYNNERRINFMSVCDKDL